jgi:hypothetical protein
VTDTSVDLTDGLDHGDGAADNVVVTGTNANDALPLAARPALHLSPASTRPSR